MAEPVEAYRATVSMLLEHAKKATRVSHDEVLEIAAMSADELRRRAIVARDWHRLFSGCLDGLKIPVNMSPAPDGCWFPADIRRVTETLARKLREAETRHLNLLLDLGRIINGDEPLNGFSEVAQLRELLSSPSAAASGQVQPASDSVYQAATPCVEGSQSAGRGDVSAAPGAEGSAKEMQ